jgi:DNA-binding MarR family transcriptional regulator
MRPDRKNVERELGILTAIGDGTPLTQRQLSARLGLALGLTNLYIRRLTRKGYVKVRMLGARQVRYLLTPKGMAEKTRLTYDYVASSLRAYGQARRALASALSHLAAADDVRIGLYGRGEAAELAYITLRQLNVDICAVFDEHGGDTFLGHRVEPISAFAECNIDRLVIATLDRPHAIMLDLASRGIPLEKQLPLRPVLRLPSRVPKGASEVGGA